MYMYINMYELILLEAQTNERVHLLSWLKNSSSSGSRRKEILVEVVIAYVSDYPTIVSTLVQYNTIQYNSTCLIIQQ